MVREREDPEPGSLVEEIKKTNLANSLYSVLFRDPIIEHILGIKPDYDYITRIAVDNFCKNKIVTVEEYGSLVEEIKDSIPVIYRNSMNLHFRFKNPHNLNVINWEKVSTLLPKKNEGTFPIEKMIEPHMNYNDKQLLHIVEFFIECALQTLIASSVDNINNTSFDNDIFRSIVAINITVNRKKYHLGILDLLGSDQIAEKCIKMLNDFYNISIQYRSLSLNLDKF